MKTQRMLARQLQASAKVRMVVKPMTSKEFAEKRDKIHEVESEKKGSMFGRRETSLLSPEEFHGLFKRAREARHHAMTTFAFYHRAFLAIRSKAAWIVAWHVARGSSYRQNLLLGTRSWKGWQPEDDKSVITRPGGATINLSTVREKSINAFQYVLRHVGVDCVGVKPCQLYVRDLQEHLHLPNLEQLNTVLAAPAPTRYWKNFCVAAIGTTGYEGKKPVAFDVLYFSPPLEWIWEAEADRKGLREVNAKIREKWPLIGPHVNAIYRPKREGP